LHKRSFEAC